jgi:hypothetical protein
MAVPTKDEALLLLDVLTGNVAERRQAQLERMRMLLANGHQAVEVHCYGTFPTQLGVLVKTTPAGRACVLVEEGAADAFWVFDLNESAHRHAGQGRGAQAGYFIKPADITEST